MKMKDLIENGCSAVNSVSGVYIVKVPRDFVVRFNRDKVNSICNPYDVLELQNKYNSVEDKSVVYIGKAKNLQRRIRQYVNFGLGKGRIHKGGRAIFQIDNHAELEIEYIECDNYAEEERKLQLVYIDKNGNLPLANRKIG